MLNTAVQEYKKIEELIAKDEKNAKAHGKRIIRDRER